MLHQLKKIIPPPFLQLYHFTVAKLAAFLYGHPSEKMVVIGVTGTNGKSSTVQFMAQMLEEMGKTVGYTTTAGFSIAGEDIVNKMKMTMPGRFYLQRLMRDMVRAGCTHAIIETSSEGIKQFRHVGINYDVAVFTNLTPEHIESHGGFEKYKQAKGRLFSHLARCRRKTIDGKTIQKVSAVNVDDEHADYFTAFEVDDLVAFSWKKPEATVYVKQKKATPSGVEVQIFGERVMIPLVAPFQQKNVVAAFAGLIAAGVDRGPVLASITAVQPIAGRFEHVDAGQPFTVLIDYAYEPYALQALFEAARLLRPKRIIGVHGSAGGGRDVARRPKIGALAAEHEAIVIVTNEDPYDEDPRAIMEAVAQGARDAGKKDGKDLLIVEDRSEAIHRAITLAHAGDLVLLTGKGSEPVIAAASGRKIPWSDREEALRALKQRGYEGK